MLEKDVPKIKSTLFFENYIFADFEAFMLFYINNIDLFKKWQNGIFTTTPKEDGTVSKDKFDGIKGDKF